MSRINKIRRFVFDHIRANFWMDYDPNEDFGCCVCGKQMIRRYLTCNQKCSDKFDKTIMDVNQNW